MLNQKNLASLLFFGLVLSACGGGGGKASDTPPMASSSSNFSQANSSLNNSSNSSVSSSSSSSSILSSISSSSLSSSSSSVASLVTTTVNGIVDLKDTNGNDLSFTDPETVSVKISLLDDQQKTLASQSLTLVGGNLQLGATPSFAGSLSGDKAKYLLVNVSKPGFTDFSRRVDVQPDVSLHAVLNELPSASVNLTQTQTISGQSINGFNVSVNANGSPSSAQAKSDLSVFIPASNLPDGTTSLNVKLRAYNPNNANDAQFFPGAYEDSDGNTLVSVAFNYADISTNTGASLKSIARKQQLAKLQKTGLALNKTSTDPVIINRAIPKESCDTLNKIGDSSAIDAGFQVPVYTYNMVKGVWDLLGQGSVYNQAGQLVASDFKEFDCTNDQYTLEIKVTNEIFLSNWWNLDYPITFQQATPLCADIQLQDQDGLPLQQSLVYAYDDDSTRSFSAENFITDSQGLVHIKVYSFEITPTDLSAKINVYSNALRNNNSFAINLSTSCAVSKPVVIKTTAASTCKINGIVKDSNSQPLVNDLILAISTDSNDAESSANAISVTDNLGRYSLDVQCNLPYLIGDYWSLVTSSIAAFTDPNSGLSDANVNQKVAGKEVNDDGKQVSLQTMTVDHSKPIGFIFNNDEGATQIDLTFFYGGSDFPLTYDFDLVDTVTNKKVGHLSGTLTQDNLDSTNQNYFGIVFGDLLLTNPLLNSNTTQLAKVSGTITDAKGNQGLINGFVTSQ